MIVEKKGKIPGSSSLVAISPSNVDSPDSHQKKHVH